MWSSFAKAYSSLSITGQVLILLCLFLVLVLLTKEISVRWKQKYEITEGYENQGDDEGDPARKKNVVFKVANNDIYDSFYADIYDHLVFNETKNNYEIRQILPLLPKTSAHLIIDLGCGTGHHVANLCLQQKHNAVGIDLSPAMIRRAKETYPTLADHFQIGDCLDDTLFPAQCADVVTSFYFAVYYVKDKAALFENVYHWLVPNGYFVVHLVNKHTFDPILPPGNPLYIVSPQKYAKQRITHTKIHFKKFLYRSNFALDEDDGDTATFTEKFEFPNGRLRKQEQKLYMEDIAVVVNIARDAGFELHSKIPLVHCAYENQYLYVFRKTA